MKKSLLLPCLLLAALLPARADIVIVELMKSDTQTTTISTKIKGDKSRTDISTQGEETGDTSRSSIIADLDTGDIITLVHESKSFVKFSPEKTKALIDELQKSKADSLASPKIIDTGRAEKIGDYNTEIYTAQTPTAKYTYWVAKNFPDFPAIQEQMRKFQIRQADLKRRFGMKDDLSPDIWTLDGMVVKTEILSQAPNEKGVPVPTTTVTTLITARPQPLDDADFKIPADYNEMEPPSATPAPAAPQPMPPRHYQG